MENLNQRKKKLYVFQLNRNSSCNKRRFPPKRVSSRKITSPFFVPSENCDAIGGVPTKIEKTSKQQQSLFPSSR